MSTLSIATHTQSFDGPFPPPSLLKEYDSLMPGTAAKIIAMAEQESEHRRQIERDIVNAQIEDAKKYRQVEFFGQIFGLIIGMFAIGMAAYAGVHGAQWTGTFIGTAGVTGLVTTFILGRQMYMKQKRQDAELARQNAQTATSLAQAHAQITSKK